MALADRKWVYLICCNDSLEEAYTDRKVAEKQLQELKTRNPGDMWFWYIRTIPLDGETY